MQANHKFRAGILNKAALMSSQQYLESCKYNIYAAITKKNSPAQETAFFIKRFVLKAIYTSFINSAGLPAR